MTLINLAPKEKKVCMSVRFIQLRKENFIDIHSHDAWPVTSFMTCHETCRLWCWQIRTKSWCIRTLHEGPFHILSKQKATVSKLLWIAVSFLKSSDRRKLLYFCNFSLFRWTLHVKKNSCHFLSSNYCIRIILKNVRNTERVCLRCMQIQISSCRLIYFSDISVTSRPEMRANIHKIMK